MGAQVLPTTHNMGLLSRARRHGTRAGLLLALWGCGDGIGQPIRSNPSTGGQNAERDSGTGFVVGNGEQFDAGQFDAGQFDGSLGFVPGTTFVPGGGVPNTALCAPVANWSATAAEQEFEMLIGLNAIRASGASCDGGGAGSATPSLETSPELSCSARLHVLDMAAHHFFSKTNLQGESPDVRIARTGYAFRVAGESIASGEAQTVIHQLISSGSADCENVVGSQFSAAGVGRYGDLWVIDFAGQ